MKAPEILLRQKVDNSSNIKHIAYQPQFKVMQVIFENGRIYWYYQVPREVYDAFISAQSKGTYFWSNIKNKYTFKRIKSFDI